jgi:hypothetical protein
MITVNGKQNQSFGCVCIYVSGMSKVDYLLTSTFPSPSLFIVFTILTIIMLFMLFMLFILFIF